MDPLRLRWAPSGICRGSFQPLEINRVPDEMKSCWDYIFITLSDSIGGFQRSDGHGPKNNRLKEMFVFYWCTKAGNSYVWMTLGQECRFPDTVQGKIRDSWAYLLIHAVTWRKILVNRIAKKALQRKCWLLVSILTLIGNLGKFSLVMQAWSWSAMVALNILVILALVGDNLKENIVGLRWPYGRSILLDLSNWLIPYCP